MSSECKKCTYSKECPDMVEPNSIYCKCHKRIPKDRTISYEELQQKVNQLEEEKEELKSQLNELNSLYVKVYKKCEQMIANRFYMSDIAIKYYADEMKNTIRFYFQEPKWQEIEGGSNE